MAVPATITFAAHLASLPRPSELAERLPKTLIHRNVPGEPVHELLAAFDRAWAAAAPQSVFGPRQRWIAAVELLARDHAGPHPRAARRPCTLAARRGHPSLVGRRARLAPRPRDRVPDHPSGGPASYASSPAPEPRTALAARSGPVTDRR